MEPSKQHWLYWLAGAALGCGVVFGVWFLTRASCEETLREAPEMESDEVEEASLDSFPASDPPSWTGSHA